MKILISSTLSSIPIVLAEKKGLFPKDTSSLVTESHNAYSGIIYLLREGRAAAGEVPFSYFLRENRLKKTPFKSLYPGAILTNISYKFYSSMNINFSNLDYSKEYIIPVTHVNSIERYVVEYYFQSKKFHRLKIRFQETPFHLLEKYFHQSDCLGMAGNRFMFPALNSAFEINEFPEITLPTNILVFSGIFFHEKKRLSLEIIESIMQSIDLLAKTNPDENSELIDTIYSSGNFPEYSYQDIKKIFLMNSTRKNKFFSYGPYEEDLEKIRPYVFANDGKTIRQKRYSNIFSPLNNIRSVLREVSNNEKTISYEKSFGLKLIKDLNLLLLDISEKNFDSRLRLEEIKDYSLVARTYFNEIVDQLVWKIYYLQYEITKLENLNSVLEIKLDRSFIDLQFSEERYRYLFEYSTDPSIIIDIYSGNIIDSNMKFRQITGYSRSDLAKLEFEDMVGHNEKIASLKENENDSVQEIYFSDFELIRKDQISLDVDLNISSISRLSGKYQIQFVNNSEKKENERLKHEFISNISHELRSPMTNIQGYFQLLSGNMNLTRFTSDELDMLKVIDKNIKRMNHLIENLLKLEQKNILDSKDDLEKFDPAYVIRDIADTYSPLAKEKKLQIVLNLEESLFIEGVKFEFSQIIGNLLNNAI
ncbi:MAG: PAS domain S-box protein, partial [Leptospiraceae bacterium]|nr:PAS domain S-box protein [Leptospiraceae bacterium]